MEAAVLTGARGGELADAKVSQFDARTASMTFVGKTRLKVEPRTVPISVAAVALFKRLADGKKPEDLLFMRGESTIAHHIAMWRPGDIAAWRRLTNLSAGARMTGATWYGRQ